MKTYIILHNNIDGMGGGQMYVCNKAKYMEKLGWAVVIFSSTDGQVMIPELNKHRQYITPDLIASPLVYSKKYSSKVIDHMLSFIIHREHCVIESGSARMVFWGELLAQKLHCKHMAHLLYERPDHAIPEHYLPYYWFKWNRRELSGIDIHSLRLLFRNDSRVTQDKCYNLPSVCHNVASEQDGADIVIPEADHVLVCLGRLEKPYVSAASKAFVHVAANHPEKQFSVVYIGDASSTIHKENIGRQFEGLKNVSLVMPGYVYPIPGNVLRKGHVYISSSGSAAVTYEQGIVTIAIDLIDNKAIGVLGYTTQNRSYRKDEPQQDPAELLEKVLFSDYLSHYVYTPIQSDSVDGLLQQHVDFLEQSEKKLDFFDLHSLKISGRDRIKRCCSLFFGSKGFLRMRRLIIKLRHSTK